MSFNDKHIVVTGGTGTLGSAVTGQLLEQGARVSIPCFKESELENFQHEGHENIFIQKGFSLTNESAAQSFYKAAVEEQGALWASVNIAGGFGMGKIGEISKQDFMKQLNLNLVTCFICCKSAISLFKGGGRIVNISSRPGLEPKQGAGMSAYSVSKAGAAALTQSLAAEVIEDDILINAVAPSVIDTPQNREAMPNADFNKWPKPKEIANQILFLISDENKLTSGAVIPVYGKG